MNGLFPSELMSNLMNNMALFTKKNDIDLNMNFSVNSTTMYVSTTSITENVRYYMDSFEAVKMEDYPYFENAILSAIRQEQLRQEFVRNQWKSKVNEASGYIDTDSVRVDKVCG